MGTAEFSIPTLERLLAEHQVVGVVTQPDRPAGRGRRLHSPPVKRAAVDHRLPLIQPVSLRKDVEAVAQIRSWRPDVIVLIAYGLIVPRQVLDIPPQGALNVHPSLLPRYRGASPIPAALLNGDSETGVTIILMEEGLDSGPILAQRREPILPEDTSASLAERLAALSADLMSETLPRWLSGEVQPVPQDDQQATATTQLRKEDGRINWNLSAVEIERRVRAYHPRPGAFTTWNGRRLRILHAKPVQADLEPGRVVERNGVLVGSGQGSLLLEVVQLEGKRAISIVEFLRGHGDFIGARLGA